MLATPLVLSIAFLATFALGHNVIANTIFQFSPDLGKSWLECVLPRDNGDLLLTTVAPSASIYTLSKPWTQNPQITSNTTLPGLNGTLGLVELCPNTFAVAAAQFKDTFNLVAGSSELWTIKFKDDCEPEVCHLASIPEAGELNDLVVLKSDKPEQEILVVDSTIGQIWKVDASSGDYSVWLDDPSMKHPDNSTARWGFGINGLRYAHDGKSLYFSNTNLVSIYNIKLNADGTPDGTPTLISEIPNVAALDNFAVDRHGRLWLTSNRDGKLVLLENDNGTWNSRIVLGGDTDHTIPGDTAVAFGRTKWDNTSLYLVTSGALGQPVPPDNFQEPAKVVRVETRYV